MNFSASITLLLFPMKVAGGHASSKDSHGKSPALNP